MVQEKSEAESFRVFWAGSVNTTNSALSVFLTYFPGTRLLIVNKMLRELGIAELCLVFLVVLEEGSESGIFPL